MPPGRLAFSLEPYKAVIWSWYIIDKHTLSDVKDLLCERFPELVTVQQGFPSIHTLERTLKQWGPEFQKRNQPFIGDDKKNLFARLWTLFYTYGLSDDEIMGFLKKENLQISKRT